MAHCLSSSDDAQVEKLKVQHKKECKGLMLQIRYLKAKFTRESTFRCDLTYQKKYLLTLMEQFEKRFVESLTAIQIVECFLTLLLLVANALYWVPLLG